MIREVILRRFKRFEEERFDLTGHVILAGPNNCGKTTVLQAIAAWSLAYKTWQKLHDINSRKGGFTRAPMARQAFSAVPLRSFDLMWKDRKYGGHIEIEVIMTDGAKLAMEFISNSTEQIYVRPRVDMGEFFAYKDEIQVVYVATVGGLSIEEPVYQPDYIETLLGRQRPGDVVRNLLLQASKSDNSWLPLKDAVFRLFGVELQVPSTPGGQIICEYKQSGGGVTFDISSAGSGFQQVIMLLACLLTRKGSVILVDEPDAHLHVFLQDTIFAELGKAAAETKSQLVIATHSEVIFNSAAPEQICIMMGKPRRLSSATEVQKLRLAVAVLQQSDLVQALRHPDLYLEGYTDLNLLREWARILGHPLRDYLNRTPFWRPKQPPSRMGAAEVPASDHFNALRLVNEQITGVWLVDSDGKERIPSSENPERQKLNRAYWKRYETESYLVHPASLARYIDQQTGGGVGAEAVRRFMSEQFNTYLGATIGAQVATDFINNPLQPPQAVDRYLTETKARTTIVGGIMQEGGIHGMEYARFNEIAAVMQPEEIHPEVKEKLDFIQLAFGL